jgi:LPXTG-motif cell wall-anchored protein
MDIEKLQAAQEVAATGNVETLVSKQTSMFAPEIDTTGEYDFGAAAGYEYTVEDFIGAGGISQRRVARKEKKAEKKEAKAEKKAEKKPGSKAAERASQKADMARAKAEAYRTSSTKDEAKLKIAAARETTGTKLGKFLGKVGVVAKKGGLAPQRAAFLVLLKMNAFGLAKKIAKSKQSEAAKYKTLEDKWYRWGGDRKKLGAAVEVGNKKKPLLIKWKKSKGADGTNTDEFIFNLDAWNANAESDWMNVAGETAALIASAVPLIIGVLQALGKDKADEDLDAETLNSLKDDAASQSADMNELQKEQDEINKDTPENERDSATGSKITKWLIIGGGILFAAGLIWYFTRKKK